MSIATAGVNKVKFQVEESIQPPLFWSENLQSPYNKRMQTDANKAGAADAGRYILD